MSDSNPLILVTNDDGIHAPGLAALARALDELGEVWVFAPDRQQSAASHSVSLHRPLRVQELRSRWYMVDGTPVDCVMLAVRELLPRRPTLVASGINNGPNLGDDVTYSGTVAGAYEGMMLGLPALAVSIVSFAPEHWESAGRFAAKLGAMAMERGFPPETVLNVNVPDIPYDKIAGVSITRMGRRHYEDEIVRREDPRGRTYYWIGGALPTTPIEPGTDIECIENNCISVTPLQRDITHHEALETFAQWGLTL